MIASHAVSREDSPQRACHCPSACARDLTAAFRYGPACFTTCGDMWVAWNSLYSALGIRCSARKRMIIRSIERVDYTAALATLVGPSIYMSTLIAGICVEIVTDRNREDARGWVHLTVLIFAGTFTYMYGSVRDVTVSGVVTAVLLLRSVWDSTTMRPSAQELIGGVVALVGKVSF